MIGSRIVALLPGPLPELARAQPLQQFERRCGARHVVLVRVDRADGELARNLMSMTLGAERPSLEPGVLRFRTDMLDPEYFERLEARSGRPRAFDDSALRRWIAAGPCFAAPLAKRAQGSAFRDRITVGRATNQDLILRHPSVSKLHCWFELAGDTVQVIDAGSTNGTIVNDQQLSARAPAPVLWGDQMVIGSVACTLAEPAAFWRAVRDMDQTTTRE